MLIFRGKQTEDIKNYSHRSLHDHDKEFHEGMRQFESGYEKPRQDTPLLYGWLAAQEIAAAKSKYLGASREKFL